MPGDGPRPDLATVIGDGGARSWDEARGAARPDDPELERELKALFDIASFYREIHDSRPRWEPVRGTETTLVAKRRMLRGPAGVAALAIVAVAAAKVVAGLALAAPLAAPVPGYYPTWVYLAAVVTFAAAAGLLLPAHSADHRSVPLGLLYAIVASSFCDRFLLAYAAEWAQHLASIQIAALVPMCLWLFVGRFPRPRTFHALDRLPGVMVALTGAVGSALILLNVAAAAMPEAAGGRLASTIGRSPAHSLFWPFVFVPVLAALPFMVWKASVATADDRARIRGFLLALALGGLPISLQVAIRELSPAATALLEQPAARRIEGFIVFSALLTIPLTTAYFVLARRLLDARVAVRRGARLALAPGSTAALALAPLAVLAVYLWLRRQLPLAETLGSTPGRAAVGLAALGLVLLAFREPLVRRLRQRLFGPDYDAAEVLAQFTEGAGAAGSAERVVELLRDGLARTLRPTATVVLLTNERDELVSSSDRVAPLPRDSSLARVLAAGDPIDLRLLKEGRLPEYADEEVEWAVGLDLSLATALRGAEGRLLGLIALGPPALRDDGYEARDRALLRALAATAGAALDARQRSTSTCSGLPGPEGAAVATYPVDKACECVDCGRIVGQEADACPECSGAVQAASLPALLFGKFELQRRIGAGGMGVVYRGIDTVLGRPLAIKTLPEQSRAKAWRLRREARAMARATHPNLALLYAAEALELRPILFFEFLEGGNLAQRLAAEPLEPVEAIDVILPLARALDRLHASGILHRDIKPSNIGFTRHGTPKLLDFGVARLLDEDTAASPHGAVHALRQIQRDSGLPVGATQSMRTPTGVIVGTPLYLSPEALTLGAADPRTDLWSLAMCLYEAVAGVHPFLRSTPGETLSAIARYEMPKVRDFAPQVPAPLADFLGDALARERHARPASAAELAATLERVRERV